MATQYPNSGKMSPNRYKEKPTQPDVTGEIVMQRSALKELMNEHDGDDIVIKISGWNMSGQYGPWTRLAWNNYKPPADGNVAKPAPPPIQRAIPDDDSDVPF